MLHCAWRLIEATGSGVSGTAGRLRLRYTDPSIGRLVPGHHPLDCRDGLLLQPERAAGELLRLIDQQLQVRILIHHLPAKVCEEVLVAIVPARWQGNLLQHLYSDALGYRM